MGFNIDINALHELQLRLSRTETLATLGQMMDRIVNQIVGYARTRELALTQFTLSDLVNEVLKLLNGPLEAAVISRCPAGRLAYALSHLYDRR